MMYHFCERYVLTNHSNKSQVIPNIYYIIDSMWRPQIVADVLFTRVNTKRKTWFACHVQQQVNVFVLPPKALAIVIVSWKILLTKIYRPIYRNAFLSSNKHCPFVLYKNWLPPPVPNPYVFPIFFTT